MSSTRPLYGAQNAAKFGNPVLINASGVAIYGPHILLGFDVKNPGSSGSLSMYDGQIRYRGEVANQAAMLALNPEPIWGDFVYRTDVSKYYRFNGVPVSTAGANLGNWNASSNSPSLPTSSLGNRDDYYIVTVAGNTVPPGSAVAVGPCGSNWCVGDAVISTGWGWTKSEVADGAAADRLSRDSTILAAWDDLGAEHPYVHRTIYPPTAFGSLPTKIQFAEGNVALKIENCLTVFIPTGAVIVAWVLPR